MNTPAIHQVEKVLAVRRLEAGETSVKALATRLKVSQATVETWARKHRRGELLKRNHMMWNPAWEREDTVVHPLDQDIIFSIKKGRPTYEDSIISLMDPEVDMVNGVSHVQWTDVQIMRLLLWMVDRSLELIREIESDSADFNEEIEFIESALFEKICVAFGYDASELRNFVDSFVADKRHAWAQRDIPAAPELASSLSTSSH